MALFVVAMAVAITLWPDEPRWVCVTGCVAFGAGGVAATIPEGIKHARSQLTGLARAFAGPAPEVAAGWVIFLAASVGCVIASIAVLASITRDEPPAGLPGLEGARLATFGRRACAQLIDCVLNVLLGALAGLRSDPWLPTLVGWAIVVCFWTFFGATPGKMAMQLRIVAVSAPERVGLPVATAISRLLGCVVSGIALNLGYLHMIKDPRRQCWHDRWAGTLVVRMGPDPAP